jgi:hypothetical protein
MIAVYRRRYGATTDYEIAWVTVGAAGSEGQGRCPDLNGSRAPGCAPAAVNQRGQADAARAHGGARISARLGEQSLASGHGAT